MNPIVKFGAWLTYIFLHLVIPLYSCLRWRLLPLTIQYLQYFLFYGLDGITLRGVKQTSRELGKVPEHIAFVFDERNPTIVSSTGLKRISSLICWAIAAGIPHISLFDSKGMLKGRARELLAEVEDSAFLEGGVMRVKGELDEQPEEVEGKGKQCRGEAVSARAGVDLFRLRVKHCRHHRFHLKKSTEGHTFSVKLLSADDGRKDIITAVQEMCRKGVKPSDFTVDSFQKAIVGFGGLPDPNLMLKFDGTAVMPLFPPWQISLTEILEVGTLQDATWPNFLNCLRWYSRSVQRFGK